ncbi:MAG: elongation factor 4 [Candidatus Westeberhardia cardiocondylae]|nr:elongation factor 4 [Candidatus Westeberhardia cardiocondylae]
MKNIRNFSIIAHVDHGKSTLSDRFIQFCGGLNSRDMVSQVLDSMELERERGITIKSQSVTLRYRSVIDNKFYVFNLIDTPGHSDFSNEVFRSLSACEGAILLIDVKKGIEAQTIYYYNIASSMNLKIIPVLNKVDLCYLDIDNVSKSIENKFRINSSDIIHCSAKTGFGITNLLEKLVNDIPPPSGNCNLSLQALIIDSWFNNYLGVTLLICIKNGILRKNDKIKFIKSNHVCFVEKLGIFTPKRLYVDVLKCGEIGWITCFIKNIDIVKVGDTIVFANDFTNNLLPGFKKVTSKVYAGFFPKYSSEYELLSNAIKKLSLNDFSLYFKRECSLILGFGFRCGFLGLLHMEIVQERLKREYNFDLIVTFPTVSYEILMNDYSIIYLDNPYKISSMKNVIEFREPIVECHILFPYKYIGSIIKLCVSKRGIQIDIVYKDDQVELIYDIPLSEVIVNFFNKLQIISHGYVSFNYIFKCFKVTNIVSVEILISGKKIDVLGFVTHIDSVFYKSFKYINYLKLFIPRQQFDVIIQAVVGNRVIVSSRINRFRKNVLEKCSGGDVSRKKKLLFKQKIGKNRMRKFGSLSISREIFFKMINARKLIE